MFRFSLLITSFSVLSLSLSPALADNGSPIYSPPPQSLDPGNAGAPSLEGGSLIVIDPVILQEPVRQVNPPPSVSEQQPAPMPDRE